MALLVFPHRRPHRGCVHVSRANATPGGFEIAHESASGNSWGDVRTFATAPAAIAAAYAARASFGACDVAIDPDVLTAMRGDA